MRSVEVTIGKEDVSGSPQYDYLHAHNPLKILAGPKQEIPIQYP